MKHHALFRQHVRGTSKGTIVINDVALLCHLTKAVTKAINLNSEKVYITTRTMKHMYDKRPAEEFDFVLKNLFQIVKYPNTVYQNKDGKRGNICLVKEIDGIKYLCCLEMIDNALYIATAFRVGNERYLKSFTPLWSWRGGTPSS